MDRIFVKVFEFLSFPENIGKNINKNMNKNLSGKYSHKLLDHAEESATDALKTASKREVQKTTGETGDLIDKKIANKITKISKKLQQNNSETVINEHDKELPKERYMSPEEG